MTRIAILTPCLVEGDAVSNDVIGMYQVLIKHGYKTQIFAENWTVSRIKVSSVDKIKFFVNKKTDILIYHYSVGWDYAIQLLGGIKCKRIIKYHNVTPPEFYDRVCEAYASVCRAGRKQLKDIVDANYDLYLADSEYNAQELCSLGASQKNCIILPPFHHIERLQDIEADLTVLDRYQDGKNNILMVGRLAPNKGHVALITAFKIYHSTYNSNSRLLIVGSRDQRLASYTHLLEDKVRFWGLQDAVVFTGAVSEQALKAYYLVSDVFMTASEHEGFCVPLVESMAMRLPIVAYGSSAIPSTVGKTGLVWEKPDPYLLAGSVDYLIKDEFVKIKLGEMGWNRYQENFINAQVEATFISILKEIV